MSSSSSNGTFSLHGVNLFLTYPQCDASSDLVEAALRTKLKHFKWAIIAREAHADGHTHLHCFVHQSKPCNLTSPTCLDLVLPGGLTRHGDYRVARDPKAALDYVCKDGNLRCCDITLEAARASFTAAGRKRTATELIVEEMEAGKPLTVIARDHPEHATFVMLHFKQLKHFYTESILDKIQLPLIFVKAQTKFPPTRWDSAICQWLNKNLLQDRIRSQPQLWIHGPTCHGKTTLKNTLEESLRTYTVPNEDFYDSYSDTSYDLIIFDEFNHEKKITWMNSFVDGSTCPLRQKGDQTIKKKNLPVIVLSNKSIAECYSRTPDGILATIRRRFLEILLEAPMEVEIVTRARDATQPLPTEELPSTTGPAVDTPPTETSGSPDVISIE
nr:MAG: replication associated protein [Arizlama virus]